MFRLPTNKIKEIPLDDAIEVLKSYSDDGTDLLEGMTNFRQEEETRTRAMSASDIYPLNCYNTIFETFYKLFNGDK
jgi:hypothetical protein